MRYDFEDFTSFCSSVKNVLIIIIYGSVCEKCIHYFFCHVVWHFTVPLVSAISYQPLAIGHHLLKLEHLGKATKQSCASRGVKFQIYHFPVNNLGCLGVKQFSPCFGDASWEFGIQRKVMTLCFPASNAFVPVNFFGKLIK